MYILYVCVCFCLRVCFRRALRWLVRASEVAPVLAPECPALLLHPRLQPAAVGALVPDHLPVFNALDSSLLLPHGLDGTKTHRRSRANKRSCENTQKPTSSFPLRR